MLLGQALQSTPSNPSQFVIVTLKDICALLDRPDRSDANTVDLRCGNSYVDLIMRQSVAHGTIGLSSCGVHSRFYRCLRPMGCPASELSDLCESQPSVPAKQQVTKRQNMHSMSRAPECTDACTPETRRRIRRQQPPLSQIPPGMESMSSTNRPNLSRHSIQMQIHHSRVSPRQSDRNRTREANAVCRITRRNTASEQRQTRRTILHETRFQPTHSPVLKRAFLESEREPPRKTRRVFP